MCILQYAICEIAAPFNEAMRAPLAGCGPRLKTWTTQKRLRGLERTRKNPDVDGRSKWVWMHSFPAIASRRAGCRSLPIRSRWMIFFGMKMGVFRRTSFDDGDSCRSYSEAAIRYAGPILKKAASAICRSRLHLRLSLRATVTRPVCRLRSLRCSSGRLTGHRRSAGNQHRHRSRPSSCLLHTGPRWARPLR